MLMLLMSCYVGDSITAEGGTEFKTARGKFYKLLPLFIQCVRKKTEHFE